MKNFISIFLLLFFLSGCALLFPYRNISDYVTSIPESHKQLEIPTYQDGTPFVYWHFNKQKEKQLNLSSPEMSSDSLIFRLWLSVPTRSINQRHDLVEIRNDNSKWIAQIVNMSVDFSAGSLSENITHHKINLLDPKSGWETLIDSLFYYKIDTLPTDQDLADYDKNSQNYSNRAPTFSFEYSTPSIYRFYQYNNPWALEEKYWQAKNVIHIAQLFDREFRVDSLATDFYKKNVKTSTESP